MVKEKGKQQKRATKGPTVLLAKPVTWTAGTKWAKATLAESPAAMATAARCVRRRQQRFHQQINLLY